ncbi:hypothetical protein NDR87_10210 [Nocardia sp. CDC159]|uniref:Uncharacterized protein n=1 Tax=Nocardia pulmonis TaxID=2951408 RepID=A0A9X2E571_9NOCA|nr:MULTISPECIES: hypothetical protein [Nocardia]MCM6773841.1 hypothetical protein [Nocardia pulmonis]MCM6786728.1 hypothetical protein [Nocardia sp. CDC159]
MKANAWLRELVDHRYAVEVLEALAARPRTARELAAAMPGSELGRTLRMLAVAGLIRTNTAGSWDVATAIPGVLRITLSGASVVHTLAKAPLRDAVHGADETGLRRQRGITP